MLASRILAPYRLIYWHRTVLASAVRNTLKARYAGSVLGIGWLVLGPLILLGLYAFIYAVVFRIRPNGLELADYIVYIFSGLIPLIAFGQALGAGTASLISDATLLQNKVFPAELIPLREVLAAGSAVLVGVGIVLFYRLFTQGPTFAWMLLPAILVLFLLSTIAIVWAFALLNLVIRDMQQVVSYLMIILLIASPIAYTPDMIPPQLQLMLYVNPLAYFVMSLQSILVLGQFPPTEILVGCIVIGLLSFHIMFHTFGKAKRFIIDFV